MNRVPEEIPLSESYNKHHNFDALIILMWTNNNQRPEGRSKGPIVRWLYHISYGKQKHKHDHEDEDEHRHKGA